MCTLLGDAVAQKIREVHGDSCPVAVLRLLDVSGCW